MATLNDMLKLANRINRLPEHKQAAIKAAFFNPTDAASICFEVFFGDDDEETLFELIDAAGKFEIENVDVLNQKLRVFMAIADDDDAPADDDDDPSACPGCGCRPGDGRTAGCTHLDGCGAWIDDEPAAPTK